MTARRAASSFVFGIVFGVVLAACAAAPRIVTARADGFVLNPGQPTRIAVLPFEAPGAGHGFFWWVGRPFTLLARAVTLSFRGGTPVPAVAAANMRSLLAARIQNEATAIVNVSQVDVSLAALPADVDRADPIALAAALDVDAVLRGRLQDIGATWYGLTTHRRLAGDVELQSGIDGHTLFRADVVVDNSAGLDHGPTGWLSLFAVPLVATDTGPYSEMAIAWAETVGAALLGRSAGDADRAPLAIAGIDVVAKHGTLGAGDVVEVLMRGTPGATANFDLGTLHREIPMFTAAAAADGPVSRADEPVTYRGVYRVEPGDRVWQAPLIVRLHRPDGDSLTQRTERLLDVDGRGNGSLAER